MAVGLAVVDPAVVDPAAEVALAALVAEGAILPVAAEAGARAAGVADGELVSIATRKDQPPRGRRVDSGPHASGTRDAERRQFQGG